MCGICGFVGRADDALVQAMADRLAHRGPDGQGIRSFCSRNGILPASLGHRRLSILDPGPRGAQPMCSHSGRYWITFNGEIYNFRELRAPLEREGQHFHSECDTEVLLAMYERHGAAMLERLNGIFAFAIWDTTTGELFLARDRLGVKPLYYSVSDETLYFASEIKALLTALPRPTLRREVVAEYLTFLWVPDPDTLFEGIYKLPPGHCATFSERGLRITQYWDMTFAPETHPEEEWCHLVRQTIQESVRRQMISDVPLGSFLSGGIDSSAIVAEMTNVAEDVTTFTIGFTADHLRSEQLSADIHYARRVADQFPIDYREQILEANTVKMLPGLIPYMGDPVADPAAITTYIICRAAREGLTVVLSGMGGDEIFAGYPRHLACQLARGFELVPGGLRRLTRKLIQERLTLGAPGGMSAHKRNLMKLARGLDLPWSERYLTYSSYYTPGELAALLSPEVPGGDPFRKHRSYLANVRDQHWLNQVLYLDMKTFLPCLNLSYTDTMSMAASVEVRVPLLDDAVVALAGRIPPELKLHRLTRKYLLKRSMAGFLPDDVIYRRKAGFGVPLNAWMKDDLDAMIADLLSREVLMARGLFNTEEVERLITNRGQLEDNGLRLWALLTLELWQREFIDSVA